MPRQIKPDQLLAHFVTIGWLLDGVKSGRIPRPSSITQANATMATLRLSFLQEPGKLAKGDVCINLSKPLHLHPEAGPARRRARAEHDHPRPPVSENVDGTYPWLYVTFGGSTLVAVRPVQFQLANVRAPYAEACTRGYIARGAHRGREGVRGKRRLIAPRYCYSTRRAASPSRLAIRAGRRGRTRRHPACAQPKRFVRTGPFLAKKRRFRRSSRSRTVK